MSNMIIASYTAILILSASISDLALWIDKRVGLTVDSFPRPPFLVILYLVTFTGAAVVTFSVAAVAAVASAVATVRWGWLADE